MLKKKIVVIFIIILIIFNTISYAIESTTNNTISYEIENTTKDIESSIYTNYAVGSINIAEEQVNKSTNLGDYNVIIEDDADLLTENEEKQLEMDMRKLTEYGNILFKTINQNPNGSTSYYASAYYHQKCGTQSGTLFLIDMYNRKIYIFSDGSNYKTITKAKAETITDNIYTYASNKQYYECAKNAYSQMLLILEGKKIAEPMKYISNSLIAIMTALFINFIIFRIASSNTAAKANELIEGCERFFEHTTPQVDKIGEHREYSPRESSSSGGSSGGRWPEEVIQAGGGGGHSF